MLMRAYERAGEVDLALRHYQALETLLRRDLQQEPAAETKDLQTRLRAALGRGGDR
jgi:DNA-binding SARP family transcriptional activator